MAGLDGLQFRDEGVEGGVWHGWLSGTALPALPARLALVLRGAVVGLADAEAAPDGWMIRATLPGSVIASGAQTLLLLADEGEGDAPPQPGAVQLGALSLLAGRLMDGEVLAEIARLRAEMEVLKQAMRNLAHRG